MNRHFLIVLSIAGSLGCASIVSGRSQELSFISNPEGATVTINGKVIGKTPLTTTLQKRSGQSLVFSKDGYKSISMRLETSLNGWFWGNIVLGGLIGSTTDGVTGSVHKYSPSQYMVTLEPEGTNRVQGKVLLAEQVKAKEFIVVGYKNIISELGTGKRGEYVQSLLNILKVPEPGQDDAIARIRGLAEAYKDIPVFADRVIELFMAEK